MKANRERFEQYKGWGYSVDANGVVRWDSNGNVPPVDCVDVIAEFDSRVKVTRTTMERNRDTDAFVARYREARRNYVPSAEEQFEMRAAFGPGETVVDVITGQTFRT